MSLRPVGLGRDDARGIDAHGRKWADLAVERLMRCPEAKCDAAFVDDLVPAIDARDRVLDVIIPELLVQRIERRRLNHRKAAVVHFEHRIRRAREQVVVVDLGFVEATFETGRIERCRVG